MNNNEGDRMLKKIMLIILAIGAAVILLVVCNLFDREAPQNTEPVRGELVYEAIDFNSSKFRELNKDDFKKWYEENYQTEGVYSLSLDDKTYVLISAGEKPTGGYGIENVVLTGGEEEISVAAEVSSPAADEIVTMALTYPHVLLETHEDARPFALKELKIADEHKKDSGTYVGQIDSNSVEIKISGVPNENAYRAFQLSEELKENLSSLEIQEGDAVLFTYTTNDQVRPVIIEIEKIKN